MTLRQRLARVRARGFSLLEVMISVAILGLALTVILSAQGGLSAGNRTAENQSIAAGLARCRMTELEEKLVKLGYPLVDEIVDEEPCCNETTNARFTCEHKIEKIELPNPNSGGAGEGGLNLATAASGAMGTNNPVSAGLDFDAGLQGMGNNLMAQMGAAGGAGGILDMVMSIVYPSIKPMMEASIRRVSVTVHWREGINARQIPIVQFVSNPMAAGFAQGDMFGDGGAGLLDGGGAASPVSSGASNTGFGSRNSALGGGL